MGATDEMVWAWRLAPQHVHDAATRAEAAHVLRRSLPWLGYFARIFGLVDAGAEGGR